MGPTAVSAAASPSTSVVPGRHRALWWAALVGAVGVLVAVGYGRTLDGFFLGDDLERIWRATAFDPTMPGLGYPSIHWRPVEDLTLRANHALGALDPFGYHLFNVTLHALVAVTVGWAAVRLVSFVEHRRPVSADLAGGLMAAALFASLPSRSQAVAWIAGRGDLLATAWGLWALLGFTTWVRTRRAGWAVQSLGCLLLALLSKESAVAVVPAATVMVMGRRRSIEPTEGWSTTVRAALAQTWASYLVVAAWFGTRWWVLGSPTGSGFEPALAGVGPLTALRRSAALLLRSVVPPMPVSAWLLAASVGAAGVAVGAAAVLTARRPSTTGSAGRAVRFRRPTRTAAYFLAAAAVAVVPVAPLGTDPTSVAGERLTYLPSVFVVLAIARGWSAWWSARPARATINASVAVMVATGVLWVTTGWWVEAAQRGRAVVIALGDLPRDRPVALEGVPERDHHGIDIMTNAVAPAVVIFHGWTDPSVIVGPDHARTAPVLRFDGREFRPDGG